MKRHLLHELADTIETKYSGVKVHRDDIPADALSVGPTSLTLFIRSGSRVAYAPVDVMVLQDERRAPLVDTLVADLWAKWKPPAMDTNHHWLP